MNSDTNTQRTVTIAYGPSFANSEVWNDIKSKLVVHTEIVSITAAQRYDPALILLDHQLTTENNHALWVEEFPRAIFLATDALKLDVDLILSNG